MRVSRAIPTVLSVLLYGIVVAGCNSIHTHRPQTPPLESQGSATAVPSSSLPPPATGEKCAEPTTSAEAATNQPASTAPLPEANASKTWNQVGQGRPWNLNDLPFLYSQLADPSASPLWGIVVGALGLLVPDARSVPVLNDFIRREVPGTITEDIVWNKRNALEMIGHIGGAEADKILRKALKPEGSRKIIGKWVKKWTKDAGADFHGGARETLAIDGVATFFRAGAAHGLIYTESAANRRIVEDLYRDLDAEFRNNPRFKGDYKDYSGQMTDQEHLDSSLYVAVVSALAEGDLFKELGSRKRFFDMDLPERVRRMDKYLVKYDYTLANH